MVISYYKKYLHFLILIKQIWSERSEFQSSIFDDCFVIHVTEMYKFTGEHVKKNNGMSGYFWYSKQNLIGTLCFVISASNLEQNLVRDSLFVKEPTFIFL